MSASRAIASARNRKAGGNYPSPTVPSQQAPTSNTSTASVPPQQPVAPPKEHPTSIRNDGTSTRNT